MNEGTVLAGTAESYLRVVQRELLASPRPECLLCYVLRMLDEFGCDGALRWAGAWRDLRVPVATGLERRLGKRGGFCDCEIFLNGWTYADEYLEQAPDTDDLDWPKVAPSCKGVGPQSTQPCALWVPVRRR